MFSDNAASRRSECDIPIVQIARSAHANLQFLYLVKGILFKALRASMVEVEAVVHAIPVFVSHFTM